MSNDRAKTDDTVESELKTPDQESPASTQKKYTVIAESGLFKRGKQFDKGDSIELDEATAASFLEAGDIE